MNLQQPPPLPELPPEGPRNVAVWGAAFEASLIVVAVLLGWALGHPPAPAIAWTWSGLGWGAAAAVPLMALLLVMVAIPSGPWASILRIFDEFVVPLFRNCRVSELAIISLLAGLGEEMLFRGVLQETLAAWVGGQNGVWFGLAVASLLFGLAHLVTPAYAVLAGLMGVYLGWLWIATGNLLVPITAHAFYDFLALVYLIRLRPCRGRD